MVEIDTIERVRSINKKWKSLDGKPISVMTESESPLTILDTSIEKSTLAFKEFSTAEVCKVYDYVIKYMYPEMYLALGFQIMLEKNRTYIAQLSTFTCFTNDRYFEFIKGYIFNSVVGDVDLRNVEHRDVVYRAMDVMNMLVNSYNFSSMMSLKLMGASTILTFLVNRFRKTFVKDFYKIIYDTIMIDKNNLTLIIDILIRRLKLTNLEIDVNYLKFIVKDRLDAYFNGNINADNVMETACSMLDSKKSTDALISDMSLFENAIINIDSYIYEEIFTIMEEMVLLDHTLLGYSSNLKLVMKKLSDVTLDSIRKLRKIKDGEIEC